MLSMKLSYWFKIQNVVMSMLSFFIWRAVQHWQLLQIQGWLFLDLCLFSYLLLTFYFLVVPLSYLLQYYDQAQSHATYFWIRKDYLNNHKGVTGNVFITEDQHKLWIETIDKITKILDFSACPFSLLSHLSQVGVSIRTESWFMKQ